MKAKLAILVALALAPLLRAGEEPAAPAPPAESPEALRARQEEVGRRLAAIEEIMRRVSRILAKTDPDKAARLDMAVRRNLEDGNLRKIEEICNYLESSLFQQALNEQRELERALERILDILLDRDADRNEVAEKLEQLERLGQTLDAVLREQTEQFHETEKFAEPEKTLQRAQDAKTRLEELIRRQQSLVEKTASKAPPGADAAEALKRKLEALSAARARAAKDPAEQERLATEAAALAEAAARLAEAAPEQGAGKHPAQRVAGALERAAEGWKAAAATARADGAAEAALEGVEQDLREAREALPKLDERLRRDASEALRREQERVRKEAERLAKDVARLGREAGGAESGARSLERAQEAMREAERRLEKDDRDGALPSEEAAKRELERAYEELKSLERELKRLIELPDYEPQAEKQDATLEKTEKLLERMRRPEGGGGQAAPGAGEVESARKAMQQASRNLRRRSGRDANADQKEAVERLQQAKKQLEEALRQLREEMQLMLLEAMERRFQAMLQKQRRLSKETIALELRVRGGAPSRADRDDAARIAGGEAELAAESEKALEILREEGTTVVIPDVVEDLKHDLDALAALVGKLQTDAYTQQMQRDVETTLEQLVRVIQEEMKRRSGGGGEEGGDSSEGDFEESLLPTSAELKMLREMQGQVNRRTELFEKKSRAGTQAKEALEEERGRIARKQHAVGELTRTMADKLNRQEDE